MRTRWIVAGMLSFASLVAACAKQEESSESSPEAPGAAADSTAKAEVQAAGSATANASVALPRIGGDVVLVGDTSVELLVHRAGLVQAVVTGPKGVVTDGVKLAATLSARGGARETVSLAFSPARGHLEGNAKAGVELGTGPVELALELGERKLEGRMDVAVALEPPALGGHLVVAGPYSAEVLLRPEGSLYALVRDRNGVALSSGVDLEASVHTKAGATERIALAYDAPRAAFAGSAKAGVALAPGPFALTIKVGGKAFVGGLDRMAFNVAATHGGQVIAVGDYSVELVTKGKQVLAFVFDANGQAVSAADLDLKLNLGARAAAPLQLKWDAPSASYQATLGAGVDLSAAPLFVSLSAAGKSFVGAVASLRGAAALSAKLVADADLSGAASVDGKLKAPTVGAKVNLSAPKAAAGATALVKAGATAGAKAGANVQITPPKVSISAPKVGVSVNKSATTDAKTGASAKGGFSFGTK